MNEIEFDNIHFMFNNVLIFCFDIERNILWTKLNKNIAKNMKFFKNRKQC